VKSTRTTAKPKLGKLIGTIRLDKTYQRAEGDYIFYTDREGNEVPILDFLGGYGASLFGHNHSELINTAISNLTNQMPFNAQISCRGKAALLGEKLNEMMFERTRKNFVVTLANSGTEAIEVAIKTR
jgi:acetylornithine/succinyldiaminopimelate/putrescine aminotransferase